VPKSRLDSATGCDGVAANRGTNRSNKMEETSPKGSWVRERPWQGSSTAIPAKKIGGVEGGGVPPMVSQQGHRGRQIWFPGGG